MKEYLRVFFILIISIFLLMTQSAEAEVKLASDITRLAVGARPLGMGKAFVGLSDDISAMYLNPAGLAGLNTHQALTMSGSFVNQVNYLTLAAAMPQKWGTIGAGYSGASLGFSTPVLNLVEIATGEYRVIPSSTESVSYEYGNYVFALTYGNEFFMDNLSFGTTLKLFSEAIGGANSASAQGMDIDAGMKYKPNSQISLGIAGKNLLPANMGGKLRWSTGLEEAIPSTLIIGANYEAQLRGTKANLMVDYEIQPTQSNIPGMMHLGAEWWPLETFAFRGGIDQDVVGTGSGQSLTITGNPTAGLSLFFSDWRFDYAFHKYNDLSTNDTHYFSLAYVQPVMIPLNVLAPVDKLITNDSSVIVMGEVQDRSIRHVVVNGQEVSVQNGKFQSETSLLPGKNTVWVAGLDSNNEVVETKRIRVLRLISFSDVPQDYWARPEIEQLGTLNIMPGFKDGTFKPEKTTQRVDYLIRLLNVGKISPATQLAPYPFKDIEPTEQVAPYIKAGWDAKLVKGYPDRTFKPWRLINRVEGAVMTVRFSKFSLGDVLERPYLDIPARHWAIKEITSAKQAGMLRFALEYLYPKKELPRSELAVMLAKAPTIAVQITELMDFEIGYPVAYPDQGQEEETVDRQAAK